MTRADSGTGRGPTSPAAYARAASTAAAVVRAACAVAAAALASPAAGVQPEAAIPDLLDASTYAVRVFRDSDGLPQNTVQAITLDAKGTLWIATQDGAASYDGQRWAVVNMPSHTRSNFVRAIQATPDGGLWFGTQSGGLHRLAEGRWSTPLDPASRPAFARINALLASPGPGGKPALWAGSQDGGVVCLEGDAVTVFDTSSGLPTNRVWGLGASADDGGRTTIWAGTEKGLARLLPGERRFATVPGLPPASVNSVLATRDAAGRATLWAGTYGSGVARLRDGAWDRLTAATGLPSDFVTSMVAGTSEGKPVVWIGTDGGGVARVSDGGTVVLDIRSGLPANAVYSLLLTHANEGVEALWIGTRNGGLARLRERQWRRLTPIPHPVPLPVNAFLETRAPDGSQVLWFGTDGRGLARFAHGEWTVFDRASGALPNDTVLALLATSAGEGGEAIWVGTRNGGVARLESGRWTVFNRANRALPNDLVQAVAEHREPDGRTSVWVGTRGGAARLLGGRWTTFDTSSGLPGASVLALVDAPSLGGGVDFWAGTDAGLARFDGARFAPVDIAGVLPNPSVQCLAVVRTPEGAPEMWLGTDGGGAARRPLSSPDAAWQRFDGSTTPALPNNTVYAIVQDLQHRVYLTTNRGVVRLTPRGGPGRLDAYAFTADDGLPLNQCVHDAALVDRQGRVWVGTVGGAAVLDTGGEARDVAPKRLVVEGTVYGREPFRLAGGAELSHRENHLVFRFTLLSFFREADTRYSTQLVGLEPSPSAWVGETRREFTTLPHGTYTFRAWGQDYAGNVAGPVDVTFTVRPAPWQTWWARLLAVALAGLAVWGGVRARLEALHRRQRELQGLVDARTRQLREANDVLATLSYVDALTGVANRRRFEERLEAEWKRGARTGAPLGLVMIDIDHFKAYNDRWGHQRGDECLRAVATALADALAREGDTVSRYGGEEFAVILPATDLAGTRKVAESLRTRVEGLRLPSAAATTAPWVTISCGAASLAAATDAGEHVLIERADEALYRAKSAGRNRVATVEPDEPA